MLHDCIEHTGARFPSGYGAKWFEGATRRAHRVAYCIAHNLQWDDIKGQLVRHTCDNPACVNPEHLELGTHQDNMGDMRSRKRVASGTRNGNTKLTGEQVTWIHKHYVKRSTEFGTVALGRKFGVHNTCIHRIITNQYHTH